MGNVPVSEPYRPHRDYRFEYVAEAIAFVEMYQCRDCVFREDDGEFPMCLEFQGPLLLEQVNPEIVDEGEKGIRCTRFSPELEATG